MDSLQQDQNSRFKLAQLWHIYNKTYQVTQNLHSYKCIVNKILEDNFDVNCKITINFDGEGQEYKIHLKDCTVLHFLLCKNREIGTFTNLIERKADFTIKNGNGQTALHLLIMESGICNFERIIPFINLVLSAHVKFKNSNNPHDNNNVSHFHAACIANHLESVELFLNNGTLVDETINFDSPKYAGYSPLHFAAEYYSIEVAKILVKHGANVNAKNAKNKTPLDLIIEDVCIFGITERRVNMIIFFIDNSARNIDCISGLQLFCTMYGPSYAEYFLDAVNDLNIDTSNLINEVVSMNSHLCDGDTALHFAANTSNIETMKLLINRGAKIDIVNAQGLTAIDICTENYGLEVMNDILSSNDDLKEICLSDGETKLIDLITAMKDLDDFKLFLKYVITDIKVIVPKDSKLWPGYTILHLAVDFCKLIYNLDIDELREDKIIVEECLNQGMSVNVQNSKGQTPIHLAFSRERLDIVELLLTRLDPIEQLVNIVDDYNLSYLHIACFYKNVTIVEHLLRSSNPNIAYKGNRMLIKGTTPLHVATIKKSRSIVEMLLLHGAYLHSKDVVGLTPIHWLLIRPLRHEQIANVLFNALLRNPVDHVVDEIGLSYLHVACNYNHVQAVEKLLDVGSNVNQVIKYEVNWKIHKSFQDLNYLEFYSNLTPLQMSLELDNGEAVLELLLRRGADIFVKGTNSSSYCESFFPIENKRVVRSFLKVLRDDSEIQKSMEEKFGLTKLHIACFLRNEHAVEHELISGVDVNAQINEDSELFPGFTPFHMLMFSTDEENIESMTKLLLHHGANVTIVNADKDTPIHVFYKYHTGILDENYTDLLFNAQNNFELNSVNIEGLSHFHIACSWLKIEFVKKFLKRASVNVNMQIDCFSKFNPGCTPLHLVLTREMESDDDWSKLMQIVDLLLEHDANVSIKDVKGDTPLHTPLALKSPQMNLLEKLVSYGGNIRIENTQGQTPIEIWSDLFRGNTNSSENVANFYKYGYNINTWNRLTDEGYISKIFLSLDETILSENSEFEKFMKSTDVKIIDGGGRTAIHNLVAHSENARVRNKENYIYAIDRFIKVGIDIDHQDESGQTALYYAARKENLSGLQALLTCGADINIIAKIGISVFNQALKYSNTKKELLDAEPKIMTILRLHLIKLKYLRIEVNEQDENLVNETENYFDSQIYEPSTRYFTKLSQNFFSQIEMTKTLEIGVNSLTLFHFLADTGAVTLYPFLLESERDLVDKFVKTIDYTKIKELKGIIKLQFKKMMTRLELINSALSSLKILLDFSVPGLCEEITRFLTNSNLKNVVRSTAPKLK